MKLWTLMLLHQLAFQGMFVLKNITLSRKLGVNIRGANPEAVLSTITFALFIIISLAISLFDPAVGQRLAGSLDPAMVAGSTLALLSLVISAAALVSLKDSWRVGVIDDHRTQLITTGIFRFTRNPYFLSYILLFFSYTILLKNIYLLLLTLFCLFLIHRMVLKEESYLSAVHGESYQEYTRSTRRYL